MKFEKSRLEPLKIELGGIAYPVRVTFGGMAELEEKLELPFLEVFNKFMESELNAREVQAMLYVMLKCGGVEVTLEDMGDVEFTIDVLNVMSDALARANTVVMEIEEQKENAGGGEKKKEKA